MPPPSSKRRGRPRRVATDPAPSSTTTRAQDGGNESDHGSGNESENATDNASGDSFLPPSICATRILQGASYTFNSAIPDALRANPLAPVTLGVDEAGRGPVLGPMVYGVAYCLSDDEKSLSSDGYDDSKKLTTEVRTRLMQDLCTSGSKTNVSVGWAVRVMSARDIGAGMLRPAGFGVYNLNAQAHDATIALIHGVINNGVNVKEIYVDTVGPPATYQAKLAKIFPSCKVTVAKKADSLYPSVSVASVVAKVTRDFALEKYFELTLPAGRHQVEEIGSGYPSDPKTAARLRDSKDAVFGWGSEVRFSWSTAADLLKKEGEAVDWAEADDEGNADIASLMGPISSGDLKSWYGRSVLATATDF